MPIISIPDAKLNTAFSEVLRLILFGDNKTAREGLLKAMEGMVVHVGMKKFGIDKIQPSQKDLELIRHAPPGGITENDFFQHLGWGAIISADILFLVLGLSRQAPRLASVEPP